MERLGAADMIDPEPTGKNSGKSSRKRLKGLKA
jgi:hypothetical protein